MITDIERYITGEMPTEEANEFKKLIASNKELAKEYKTTFAAHEIIKEAGRLEMKGTLESFDQKLNSRQSEKVIPLWLKRLMPIAAMLVIFFGVYYMMMFNSPVTGNEVYQTYFETYNTPNVFRSSENTTFNNWELGVNYYQDRDFENAILHFKKSENEVPVYLSAFYIGISSMNLKSPNYIDALENFEKVLTSDNDYHQQVMWYKGLTLLKLNRQEESLEIFKLIVKEKGYNYLKAKEILNLNIEY